MTSFLKSVIRMFKKNILRLIFMVGIILIGVAFVSGLSVSGNIIKNSINTYYDGEKVSDVILKATNEDGISQDDVNKIKELDFVDGIYSFFMYDINMGEDKGDYRIYLLDYDNLPFNYIDLIEGNYPQEINQIVIEKTGQSNKVYNIGDVISFTLDNQYLPLDLSVEVSGIVSNPLYLAKQKEYSQNTIDGSTPDINSTDTSNLRQIDCIFYIDTDILTEFLGDAFKDASDVIMSLIPKTDAYIKFNNLPKDRFSDEYKNKVNENIEIIKDTINNDNYAYIGLSSNLSYRSILEYTDKVDVLALIFPVFFIAVSALVTLVTTTRLIEDERGVIGTYMTLGISRNKILMKYLSFGLISGILGLGLGFLIGLTSIPPIIYNAFTISYFMPEVMDFNFSFLIGGISSALLFIIVLLITFILVYKYTNIQPADLLRPKAPKPGKKILLERIPFIWKHLSFSFKSTFRNLFRQKLHLIMTILSVAGSTVLIFCGFGLVDVSNGLSDNPDLASMLGSLKLISFIIVLFAITLCLLVVFNLTNMNISERERELATLKVLGYNDFECSMYTFREILISSIFGIIIGLPLGYLLLSFVLDYVDLGNMSYVNWYSYIICVIVILIAVLIVNILLNRNIRKINMSDSLKSVE